MTFATGSVGPPGRAADLVSFDVVRPDDDAFTQLRDQGRDQVGEGVSSQVSSEVIPPAGKLFVHVAPRGSAQGAGVAFRHLLMPPAVGPPSICVAKPQMAFIMRRRRAIASVSTAMSSSSLPLGV